MSHFQCMWCSDLNSLRRWFSGQWKRQVVCLSYLLYKKTLPLPTFPKPGSSTFLSRDECPSVLRNRLLLLLRLCNLRLDLVTEGLCYPMNFLSSRCKVPMLRVSSSSFNRFHDTSLSSLTEEGVNNPSYNPLYVGKSVGIGLSHRRKGAKTVPLTRREI